jgi:hypothetical protein
MAERGTAGQTFQNVQEVWVALGGMVERRF